MEGSSNLRNSNVGKRKEKMSRRVWSLKEEQELVSALKELVARGYKCENGFKAGYLGILEQSMVHAFPLTDLKAEPHINSKIHVWKKQYASLSSMLSKSGIGLNPSTFNIEANDDVWDAYVKTDNYARTMRFKSWPLYNDWAEIFGKDRATGESAEAFADVVQDLLNNNNANFSTSMGADSMQFSYFNDSSNADFMSVGREESSSATKKGKSKKRKGVDELDERFMETMNAFCEKTDSRMGQIADRMGDLAQRVGAKFDASKKREMVFESLGNLAFLSLEARVHVAQILCNNSKELDLFFSLPDDAKALMVKNVINRECGGTCKSS